MKGKEKCKLLKAIRRQIAGQYGLEYHPTECHHKDECAGTCPRCDAELQDLQHQLEQKGIHDINLSEALRKRVNRCGQTPPADDEVHVLQGDAMPLLQGIHARYPDSIKGTGREYIPKKRKAFFKECPIAGWKFHAHEYIWDELCEGTELALIREKNNEHDRNAVAVALADDYAGNPDDFDFDFIIGYVPRNENEFIASMMDLGWSDAFTAELTTVKEQGPSNGRLRMTIYIQSKDAEPEEDGHGSHIYAQKMNDDYFKEFTDTLCRQGYFYFRWSIFPPLESGLPREGQKVVFIHEKNNTATLYLMHILAMGDNSAPYLKNAEELDMIDDCYPYVLTNVKGPVVCASKDLSSILDENISCIRPDRLSDYAVNRIKEIFGTL